MREGSFLKNLIGAAGIAFAAEQGIAHAGTGRADVEQSSQEAEREFAALQAEYQADSGWYNDTTATARMVERFSPEAEMRLPELDRAEYDRMWSYAQNQFVELNIGGEDLAIKSERDLGARLAVLRAMKEAPQDVRHDALETLQRSYDRLQSTIPVFEKMLDGEAEKSKLKRIASLSADITENMNSLAAKDPEVREKELEVLPFVLRALGPSVQAKETVGEGYITLDFGQHDSDRILISYNAAEGKVVCKLMVPEELKSSLQKKLGANTQILVE